MPDPALLTAALERLAPGRIQAVRIEGDRTSAILDVTGLSGEGRRSLETAAKALLADSGAADIRVLLTSDTINRTLIAVASGKGGVGKSTVAANLAIALARQGRSVGLIDADIYGPSQPRLMGVEGSKPQSREKTLIPVPTPYGVPLLSMGQLVPADQAIAWRGPMASGALAQLAEADWGACDTLVIDLPPGTGDVQLSLIQKYRPAGAVIVSTPQDLALIDARRAIDLFVKAGIRVIGVIENMAGYACPHCGGISDPFGSGGAEAAAAALGLPFLGRIPLDIAIRTASDAGEPPAAGTGPEAAAFIAIATRVTDWLATASSPGDR